MYDNNSNIYKIIKCKILFLFFKVLEYFLVYKHTCIQKETCIYIFTEND